MAVRRKCCTKHLRNTLYGEIRTPMFEHYEVISRSSVGDTTDIVTKEM